VKYVGPESDQGSCRAGHRDLLLGEHPLGEVVRDVVRPGDRPVRDALPGRQRNDLGRAVLIADVGQQDPAQHLRGRLGALGHDEAVVDEVAVVALVVVDGSGVLGPQRRPVQPQVG